MGKSSDPKYRQPINKVQLEYHPIKFFQVLNSHQYFLNQNLISLHLDDVKLWAWFDLAQVFVIGTSSKVANRIIRNDGRRTQIEEDLLHHVFALVLKVHLAPTLALVINR